MVALELRFIDLQISKNNKEHHTKEMGLKRLIVRRGQPFTLQVHFNRPFHSRTDHITFVAETGEFTAPLPKAKLTCRAPVSAFSSALPLFSWDPRTLLVLSTLLVLLRTDLANSAN